MNKVVVFSKKYGERVFLDLDMIPGDILTFLIDDFLIRLRLEYSE